MEDTRLLKCGMFGELVGGTGCMGGQEKEGTGCFLDDLGVGQDQGEESPKQAGACWFARPC